MTQLNFQNPNLCAKMRALIQKAFSIMKPNLDEALGIRTGIVKKGQTSPFLFTLLSSSKPRFDYLINRYKHVYVEKLPESKDCKDLMESDRAILNYVNKYVGTSRGLVWIWTSTYVDYILEKIVERYFYEQKDEPEFFSSLYHDFEKLCYDLKKNVKLSEIITQGIESFMFKPIQLDDNLRIKKITNEDNKELFDLMQSNHLSLFEVGEPEFAIECEVTEPLIRQIKKPDDNIIAKYQSEDTIDAVVTGLRLFRSCFVGYSNIFPLKKLNVLLRLKHKAKNVIRENELGAPYEINQNDLQELRKF
jgi:hypothetical protein